MAVHFTNRNYAENRFMNKGVELQQGARNWWEAKRYYNYSCMLCASRGCGAVQCCSCPIRSAMLTNALIFKDRMPKQEKEWARKEQELL